MKARTGFRYKIQSCVILLSLLFEIAHSADRCGTVEILFGKPSVVTINSNVTKQYPIKLLELSIGTGTDESSCLKLFDLKILQNLLLVTFYPATDKCELLFCGTSQSGTQGGCYQFGNGKGKYTGSNYYKLLENNVDSITSIMCGCSATLHNSTDCKENQCHTNFNETKFGPCGSVLYESNCTSCVFPPTHLKENKPFKSCHEASVKSVVVKQGYKIIRTLSNGIKKEYSESTSFDEEFKTLYGSTGDEFVCQKIVNDAKLSPSGIVFIVLGVLSLLTVITGGVFLERHMRKRNFRHQFVQMIKDLKVSEMGMANQGNGMRANGKHLYDPKWELNRADLKLNLADSSKMLGTGTFGKVIQGKLVTKDGSGNEEVLDVAVKTFHALDAVVNLNHIKALINEIRVMSFTGYHPNIVRFHGAHIDLRGGHIFCVMELCSKQSLLGHLISLRSSMSSSSIPNCATMRIRNTVENGYHVVEQIGDGPLEPDTNPLSHHEISDVEEINQTSQTGSDSANIFKAMVQWSMNIANGMSFLQQNNILHIDLAARNILLTSELTAKISDFGLSRRLYTSLDEKTGEDSTQKTYKKSSGLDLLPYKYIALESLLLGSYSLKSDVWSFGIALWEIFSCGMEPYCNISEPKILQLFLQSGRRLSAPEHATNEIYCQMLSCWTDEPHVRPDFKQLHSFFHSLHESLLDN